MFTLGKEAIFERSNIAKWTALSFQAGAINAIGVLAGHRFVSHVTGFASLAAIEYSKKNLSQATGMLSVPVFFLLGAAVSGYFIDLRVSQQKKPAYKFILFLIFVCNAVAFTGSLAGLFGGYGEDFSMEDHYVLLVLLSMCCGLQNALITSASGSVIRTTHLTGITTDLGIGISRLIFGRKSNSEEQRNHRREIGAFWMRLAIVSFFFLGSLCSAVAAKHWGYGSLGITTLTSLALWAVTRDRVTDETSASLV